MASKAFRNALKMSDVEVLIAKVEFDLTEDTQTFDLGDIDLTQDDIRVEVRVNGTLIEDGDWVVNANDNTAIDINEVVAAKNEVNFRVFRK